MIVYQKKLLRIAEYWSTEEPKFDRVDLVRCFQRPQPVTGMTCREFHTILLDLNRDCKQLLSGIKRDTRYEIRRAELQDKFVPEYWPGGDERALLQFSDYYDEFAVAKGQPKLNRFWLSQLAEAGVLLLSKTSESTGETLVWHAYHRSNARATLLYSASLFRQAESSSTRNKIGRANRFQHWEDIKRFKSEGLAVYDFGGWYEGDSDQERLRINHFKEEFGGEITRNYICERALTLKAKVFLRARRILLGNAI
jgi:hypothetical protein